MLAVSAYSIFTNHNDLRVKDCVRELGYFQVEIIDYIAPSGAVETQDYPDKKRYFGYANSTKLIKVECK